MRHEFFNKILRRSHSFAKYEALLSKIMSRCFITQKLEAMKSDLKNRHETSTQYMQRKLIKSLMKSLPVNISGIDKRGTVLQVFSFSIKISMKVYNDEVKTIVHGVTPSYDLTVQQTWNIMIVAASHQHYCLKKVDYHCYSPKLDKHLPQQKCYSTS